MAVARAVAQKLTQQLGACGGGGREERILQSTPIAIPVCDAGLQREDRNAVRRDVVRYETGSTQGLHERPGKARGAVRTQARPAPIR
jgi:hypothetical protein